MKNRRRITVLIGSENRLFRECLADRIARDGRFRPVGTASGLDLLAQIRTLHPEMLLFDLDELGAAPESLLARIRSLRPAPRVLALLARGHDASFARILRYGAAGAVAKDESVGRMLRAMLAVASGETWAPSKAIAQALSNLVEDTRQFTSSTLTLREQQLLSLLGEGYRNKELAALLRIKEQTVKIHLHSLFRKLNVRTRVEAALKAAAV
jgi:DNA-binding NarL/FixJ family response regulator